MIRTKSMDNEENNEAEILTNGEAVYQQLYDAILENQLKPTYRLQEEKLAKTFKVSRTIIREALQHLYRDKLICLEKNKGASVYHPSIKESKEIFFTRRVLEISSMNNVIKNIKVEQVDKLKILCKEESKSLSKNNSRESLKLSAKFHLALVEIANNNVVTNILTGLVARTTLIISAYGAPSGSGCSCGTHEELLEIMLTKDAGRAIEWLDNHFKEIEGKIDFKDAWNASNDFSELFNSI